LGASTDEAQVSVAVETAEEVRDFLQSGVARNSLNFPTMDPHDMPLLAPWFRLCEALGLLLAQYLKAGLPRTVTLRFQGDFATGSLDSLRPGFLRGLLLPFLGEATNYVNAPLYAKEHGLTVHLEHDQESFPHEYRQMVRVETIGDGAWVVEGSVMDGVPHVISLQETAIEVRLEGVVLLVENRDVPNMVGAMGSFVGSRGVNIARLELARQEGKETALTAIALDSPLSEEDLIQFRRQEGIVSVFQVDFGNGNG
jgi:D-3-phosphoglycerate dehydrogenase